MNTNNRSNNRRRGRGNNRGPGGGGQSNRIDNRARGNAPQMLEKYKKLAHDASLNDDRVQTEYYLQFADHYFRVIADSKAPKDEHRPRRDETTDDQDEDNERDDRASEDRVRMQPRPARERRPNDDPRLSNEGSRDIESDAEDEENDNPFLREARPSKSARTRSRRKAGDEDSGGSQALDPERLPPSIVRHDEDGEPTKDVEATGKARVRAAGAKAPRATKRRASPAEEGDAEAFKEAS